jgi:hypothetical protein
MGYNLVIDCFRIIIFCKMNIEFSSLIYILQLQQYNNDINTQDN